MLFIQQSAQRLAQELAVGGVCALKKVAGNLAKAPDKLQSGACKRQRTSDAIAV